jgi:type IV pilus assembly protein PilN
VAQSNASVAEYMRNVESSPWMGHTDLRKTENTHDATRMPYAFGLDVTLSRPKADEADAGKEPVQPAEAGSSAAPPASAAPATSGTAAKATTVAPAKPADAPAKRVVPEAKPVSAPATVGAKP